MKKILAFTLALMLVFALAACGSSDTETSSAASSSAPASTSSDESSQAEEPSSPAESSATEDASSAVEASSAETPSEDVSDPDTSEPETSEDEPQEIPEYITNFLSIGTVDTAVRATSTNAVRLTGIDVDPSYGAIVLYTPEYGPSVSGLENFAVAVFEYTQKVFGYVKTGFYAVGEEDEVEIPDDGFLIAASKEQGAYVDRLKGIKADETVFPHGVHICTDIDYTIKKASKAPTIDGKFVESEWKSYKIDEIDSENNLWSYAQFEKDTYYATATYYSTYDDENIYLCVVVSSPYHYCPITTDKAGDMWQYECIQVKATGLSPAGEYFMENYDHVINNKAVSEGILHSYGFACNDEGETCFYESGKTFPGQCACSRDDSAQLTVYEVAIPWSSLDVTPEKGLEVGLTFSVNSTNADDIAKKIWKNITYRCGGGVIGRNDWSKMPVVTLG